MTEAMKRFSPRVVLDKSLADRVYNLSSKGIDVQFQHLQPIEETDLETVNPFSSESDIELRQKLEEELETQRKSLLERFYKKQEQKQKKKRKLDY